MCTPTSSCSPCLRLGDIACFALAGSDFRLGGGIRSAPAGFVLRLDGSPHADPAGFILGVGTGGLRVPALAGVASAFPRSGQLGLQGPPAIASWSFTALATKSTMGRGYGAVCGIACALVLRALVGTSWAAFLAMAPELGNRGRKHWSQQNWRVEQERKQSHDHIL